MNLNLYPQHKLEIKLLLAVLPVRHVYREEIIKILVMMRIKKMRQFMQDNIFHTRNTCLVQIEVQVDLMAVSAKATP